MAPKPKVLGRLTNVLDISLSTANTLFGLANLILVLGTVFVLAGTIGAIWTSSIKERYADERISGNEATTASARADAERARADAAKANESTEILRQSNLALQADVERERAARLKLEGKIAPRHLSDGQKAALLAALKAFKGQKIDVVCLLGDSEGKAFALEFDAIFRAAGWDDGGGSGINQAVIDPPEPVGIEVTLNQAEVQAGRVPKSAVALLDTLMAVGLVNTRQMFMNPQSPGDRITFRVGRKPQ
jgi:hypothetical protein